MQTFTVKNKKELLSIIETMRESHSFKILLEGTTFSFTKRPGGYINSFDQSRRTLVNRIKYKSKKSLWENK